MKPHFYVTSGFSGIRVLTQLFLSSEKNSVSPASYPDVSPPMKICAQRKAGRRKWARRRFDSHFSLSHSSLRFIISHLRVPCVFAHLCVKNAAPEEEANLSPKKTGTSTRKLLTGTDCSPKVKKFKLVHNCCFMLNAVLSMNCLALENISIITKKTYTRSDPSVSDTHYKN